MIFVVLVSPVLRRPSSSRTVTDAETFAVNRISTFSVAPAVRLTSLVTLGKSSASADSRYLAVGRSLKIKLPLSSVMDLSGGLPGKSRFTSVNRVPTSRVGRRVSIAGGGADSPLNAAYSRCESIGHAHCPHEKDETTRDFEA